MHTDVPHRVKHIHRRGGNTPQCTTNSLPTSVFPFPLLPNLTPQPPAMKVFAGSYQPQGIIEVLRRSCSGFIHGVRRPRPLPNRFPHLRSNSGAGLIKSTFGDRPWTFPIETAISRSLSEQQHHRRRAARSQPFSISLACRFLKAMVHGLY